MKRILFYPGTFNPPHIGHVSAVKVATDHIDFDEVWVMPSGKRVDKAIPTSSEDRLRLGHMLAEHLQTTVRTPVKLISSGVDGTDDRYTHEIIIELKSRSKDEILQLVGIDGFLGIKERVIGPDEKFVIIKRSGYEFPEGLESNKNLVILEEEVGGISSTKIREMVRAGDDGYKNLVPKKIAAYIEERGLYRESAPNTIVKKSLFETWDSIWQNVLIALACICVVLVIATFALRAAFVSCARDSETKIAEMHKEFSGIHQLDNQGLSKYYRATSTKDGKMYAIEADVSCSFGKSGTPTITSITAL